MGFIKGFLKFLPVFVLAGLMISGQDAMIAAPLAFVCAVVVAMVIEKKRTFWLHSLSLCMPTHWQTASWDTESVLPS